MFKNLNGIATRWRNTGLGSLEFNFSCYDGMGETYFDYYDTNGKKIDETDELIKLSDDFVDEIYNNVTFYQFGDGHYQGEFGKVIITMCCKDDVCVGFSYDKISKSEWTEVMNDELVVATLTDDEKKYLKNKVQDIDITGTLFESLNIHFMYNGDVFLSEYEMYMEKSITHKIKYELIKMKIIKDDITYSGDNSKFCETQNTELNWSDEDNLIFDMSMSFDIVKDDKNGLLFEGH